MAAFRWPEDRERLDWDLLQYSPVCQYRARDVLQRHIDWLRSHAYLVHVLDCAALETEEACHHELCRMLGSAAYPAGNLDAFNAALATVDVPVDGGLALVFLAFDRLWAKSPERAWCFLDILAVNSRRLALTGRRMLALVQSADPGLHIRPVGAVPVVLNRAEWVGNLPWPPACVAPDKPRP